MAGEAVDLKIQEYMTKHNVGYAEAYNRVVFAPDASETVRAYQEGRVSVGDLLARLRGGISRLEGLARDGGPSAARLLQEAKRLLEILESARDRHDVLVSKTSPAVDRLLQGIETEAQRRSQQRARLQTQELGGLAYERPADRGAAGAELDRMARSYIAEHGGTYQAAFNAVTREHPHLVQLYGSVGDDAA